MPVGNSRLYCGRAAPLRKDGGTYVDTLAPRRTTLSLSRHDSESLMIQHPSIYSLRRQRPPTQNRGGQKYDLERSEDS
ncbi:hypothetical protein CC2G_011388 [Coprinopsis cinerea AmutBmut pab1-1]|nr:hypothetical protein CC2G_011388 [Coprinopsis cinerea AmutBmut pab1-1]